MENMISMQALKGKADSIYKVVRAAALRAKELNMGGKTLLDKPTSKNYATIALQEIVEDKIKIMRKEEVAKLQNPALKIFGDVGESVENEAEEKEE